MAAFSQNALSNPVAEPGVLLPAQLPPFVSLYREHFAFVWRTLQALGVHSSALDDAVQEVFIVVHRRGGDFEGRSSVKTWVFGIAYRVAANYRRSDQRRAPHEELSIDLAADTQNPQDAAQAGEAARFLKSFLDQLPETRRAVFTGCVLEQMTAPELAEVLGCPVGTVYTRLRTVRAEFRQALAERALEGVLA